MRGDDREGTPQSERVTPKGHAERFSAWLDRLIGGGSSSRSLDDRRRARLCFAFAAVSAAGAAVYLLVRTPLGYGVSELWPVGLSCVLAASVLVWLRAGRSLAVATNILVASWFVGMSWATFLRGGASAQPAVVMALMPFFATMLVGKRAGFLWFAIFMGGIIGFAYYDDATSLYDRIPETMRLEANTSGAVILGVLLFAAGLVSESLRSTSTRELEQADKERRDAENEARLLRADRLASVGQMVASLAHEINNPLMYVQGNLDFISDEAKLDNNCREALADAIEGAYRVSSIVRDLKTFARADEEKRRAVDIKQVVESTLRMVEGQIRARGTLETAFGTCPKVQGSETRLGQVVLNLLVNAVQATPEGRTDNAITLSIGTRDGWAEVIVADQGVGIAPENLERVTEPFFTTKPVGVGTGLGLAVCRSIIERHGGRFEIESTLGKGTTITLLLPPASQNARTTGSFAAIEHPAAPTRKVLVIDDDPIIAKTLRRTLRGHDLTVCSSGSQALEVLEAGASFDLVLCDLMMPEMTGMDLHAELLRREDEIADSMVFITGGAFGPHAREFLDSVPNRRLQKPLDRKMLAELLANPVGEAV